MHRSSRPPGRSLGFVTVNSTILGVDIAAGGAGRRSGLLGDSAIGSTDTIVTAVYL